MIKTNVLIVGGGPAGSTVSRYLSKNGIENILVQKNCDYRKPCGGGIRYTAFKEFDLNTSVAEKKVEKIEIGFKEKRIFIDIKETPIFIVDRKKFDKYLRELAKKEGSSVIEGSFLDFYEENGFIISRIKVGDKTIAVKSKYLIAADGVNSVIRKKVFKEPLKKVPVQYVDIPDKDTDRCSFFFGEEIADKYYGWVFPHFEGINIGTYKGKLENFLKYLGIETNIKPKGFFIPLWEENIPVYKKNIFFVGDSAGQVLPFTFEGIYYAMASGKILADVLSNKGSGKDYLALWNERFFSQFSTLKKLQNIFLKNNISIFFMIKLFENEYIQREMIKLWLGKRTVDINIGFFIRTAKRILGI